MDDFNELPEHKNFVYSNCEYKVTNSETREGISCVAEVTQCEPEDVYGCTDEEAINYDPEATKDDESCEYRQEDPKPEPQPEPQPQPLTPAGAPSCSDSAPTRVPANFHMYRNGTLAMIKWLPDVVNKEGNKVAIYYGINGQGEQHALVTDNDGYEVINLFSNGDFTFWGQVLNGCAGGPKTKAVVDGATKGWVLFTQ